MTASRAERPNTGALRIREAVRAVVIDPERRVLLVRFEFPTATVWGTPGGGIETDEQAEHALRRELREELGLTDFVIGPYIWDRVHVIPFVSGLWDGQHDRFFLIETPAFEPAPTLTWDQLNAEYVFEMRWWTADELAAFVATSDVFFAPRRLPDLYRSLLADGVPAAPIDTGR
jgi:8-oxo-dGTP diphosphatase